MPSLSIIIPVYRSERIVPPSWPGTFVSARCSPWRQRPPSRRLSRVFFPVSPDGLRAEGGDAKGDDDCARRGLSCDAIGGVACAEARPGAEHGAGGRAGRRRTFVDGRTELYLGGLLKKAWDAEGDKSDAAFLSLLNEYDVSWALVAPGTEAVDKLRRSAQWKEIFQDGDAELFVRN
jgi:hypothetical protein